MEKEFKELSEAETEFICNIDRLIFLNGIKTELAERGKADPDLEKDIKFLENRNKQLTNK